MPTPVTSWYSRAGRRRWLAGLCLAGLALPAPLLASSLAPARADAVAGRWLLFPDARREQGCTLELTTDGQASSSPATCGALWLGAPAARWMSKPDGLALATGERMTLLMLNPAGQGRYRGRSRQGLVLWLERL